MDDPDPDEKDDHISQKISDMERKLTQMKCSISEDMLSKPGCSLILNGLHTQLLISITEIRSQYRQIVADAQELKLDRELDSEFLEIESEIRLQQGIKNATQTSHHDVEPREPRATAIMSELSLQHVRETQAPGENAFCVEPQRAVSWEAGLSQTDMQPRIAARKLSREREASEIGENSLQKQVADAQALVQRQSDQLEEKDRIIEDLKRKLADSANFPDLQFGPPNLQPQAPAVSESQMLNDHTVANAHSETDHRPLNFDAELRQQREELLTRDADLENQVQQLIADQELHQKELDTKDEQLRNAQAAFKDLQSTHTRLQTQANDIEKMTGKLKRTYDERVGKGLRCLRDSVVFLMEWAGQTADLAEQLGKEKKGLTARLDSLDRDLHRRLHEQRQEFLAEKTTAARKHSKAVSEAVANIRAIYDRRQKEIDDFPLENLLLSVSQPSTKRPINAIDDSPSLSRGQLLDGKRQKTMSESQEKRSEFVERLNQDPIQYVDDSSITIVGREDSPPSGEDLLQTDRVTGLSASRHIVDTGAGQDAGGTRHASAVEDTADVASQTNHDQGVQIQSVAPPPPPPPFVPPTSTDPSDLADAIFSLFYPMWDVTDEDENEIKTTWRSAFRCGKTFAKAVEELDRHVLGTSWTKSPEYPRGCLMADVTSKPHGSGGYGMSQDSCPYCGRKSRTKRFCQWALLVPGLQLGFRDRVNGQLAPGERTYTGQMNNLTKVLDGRRVRYLLFKRREAWEGDYTIPVKTVDGVQLPPIGTS